MPVLHLTDLPTENELDQLQLELESFVEAFQRNQIGPMAASVEPADEPVGYFSLGGYTIPANGRWYKITGQ
ncbi:hypothetical protein [Herbaspirillum huttiense]|uniref:hypothetical protein n=1 Tax=Herbaspirillum huttiense TaxID=863372 RepID=UPI0039AEFD82